LELVEYKAASSLTNHSDLPREKASLWEKADSLEYENLLKSKTIWQEDSNAKQCVQCSSQFSFILRKVFTLDFEQGLVV
jgi:hypothetical protein